MLGVGDSLRSRSFARAGRFADSCSLGSGAFYHPMHGPKLLERITARRAELDAREELAEVRDERDELAVAERVVEQVSEQLANERAAAALRPGRWAGER